MAQTVGPDYPTSMYAAIKGATTALSDAEKVVEKISNQGISGVSGASDLTVTVAFVPCGAAVPTSAAPTTAPSPAPSAAPTAATAGPTAAAVPTDRPSPAPSASPSRPSPAPTASPTRSPSASLAVVRVSGCDGDGAPGVGARSAAACPSEGGVRLTIALAGVAGDAGWADGTAPVAVRVGADRCCDVRRDVAHDALTCALPPGRGFEKAVAVTVGDRSSDGAGVCGGAGGSVGGGGAGGSGPTVSYKYCAEGSVPHDNACAVCGAGKIAPLGSPQCVHCPKGTFSRANATRCEPCTAPGADCSGAHGGAPGVLRPLSGFWAPAVHTSDPALFDASTVVFACLRASSCEADPGATRPAAAYRCAEGHRGVLCASCAPAWYFSRDRCLRCDASPASPVLVAVAAAALAAGLALAAYRWHARRHSARMVKQLHSMRKALKEARKERRRRRGKNARKKKEAGGRAAALGGRVGRACAWWRLRMKKAAVFAVHEAVTSARDKLADFGGESSRIVLNASKCVSHLNTTLNYCLTWPKALERLRPVFRALSFNVFGLSRSACWFVGYDYYTQLRVAMLAPVLLTLALVLGGMVVHAYGARRQRRRSALAVSDVADFSPRRLNRERRAALRKKHLDTPLKAGLWTSAHAVLWCLDLLYPAICRVLFQFVTCRNLQTGKDGSAGWWLEARQILQNTFSDRTHCIAQLWSGSSFLRSALQFLDRPTTG